MFQLIVKYSDILIYKCPSALIKVDFTTYQGQEIQFMRDLGKNDRPSFRNWTHDMFDFMCIIIASYSSKILSVHKFCPPDTLRDHNTHPRLATSLPCPAAAARLAVLMPLLLPPPMPCCHRQCCVAATAAMLLPRFPTRCPCCQSCPYAKLPPPPPSWPPLPRRHHCRHRAAAATATAVLRCCQCRALAKLLPPLPSWLPPLRCHHAAAAAAAALLPSCRRR